MKSNLDHIYDACKEEIAIDTPEAGEACNDDLFC
jgi:hypothetical protein